MLKPTQDKELIDLLAREILCNNWDGSRKNAEKVWDENIPLIDKEPYLKKAKIYLSLIESRGYHIGLPSDIEWALNSGDGTYRP